MTEFLCPAWHGPCSQRCFIRYACAFTPEKVMNLVERLDVQTEMAMVEYVQRLRRT